MMWRTLPTVLALGALAAVANSAVTPATYYDIMEVIPALCKLAAIWALFVHAPSLPLSDMMIDPRSVYGAFGIFIKSCDDNFGISNPGGLGPGGGNSTDVRANAPEWIRTLFHDCASYDASTGTGGCDASVQFELSRVENLGSAIHDTIAILPKPAGISFADVLVAAAVSSIKVCGGPIVPVRFGRIDATAADNPAFNVPLETENITTHTNQFSRMGFTKQEMISLIACGHTVGRVHGVDKPALVNGQDSVPFDHTPFVFDTDVAVSYLNGTTPNALVNGPTAAQRSDFDIFNSDGNATMIGFANNPSNFMNTCAAVFQKLTERVPSNVNLGPILNFRAIRFSDLTVEATSTTSQGFNGRVKIFFPAKSNVPNITSAELRYLDKDGQFSSSQIFSLGGPQPSNTNLDSPFGVFSWIGFHPSVPVSSSVSLFWATATLSNGTVIYTNATATGLTVAKQPTNPVYSSISINTAHSGYGANGDTYQLGETSPSHFVTVGMTTDLPESFNGVNLNFTIALRSTQSVSTYGVDTGISVFRLGRLGYSFKIPNGVPVGTYQVTATLAGSAVRIGDAAAQNNLVVTDSTVITVVNPAATTTTTTSASPSSTSTSIVLGGPCTKVASYGCDANTPTMILTCDGTLHWAYSNTCPSPTKCAINGGWVGCL
ncbi:heme peroxidase [Polychytrium aggregatum]|uniref:heme peroxidase n=1 Tax=Polychytrium aggregatum TaxID=110093 RepID=UPI0022FEA82D|nr:heme peroxidase [Polychytrium aggregatum]KAI9199648.1 heme peroxidase [Polychytrium aggregatum]